VTDLYKVQKQDAHDIDFQDVGEWGPASECIGAMRDLIFQNPLREVRVIAENGLVIASTRTTPREHRTEMKAQPPVNAGGI
jgi:uncharacterized protein (DUF2461 family)